MLAPLLPPLPATDPFSLNGVLILANQLLIGLSMGMAVRIVFAAIELAGELVALTMGLNFATFFDPQSHGATSVVSQFLLAVGTLTFLALDGHLILLSALVDSFRTLPLGSSSLGSQGVLAIAEWGSTVFSAALQLSLPMVAALLIASASLGILTRAAPQLNIFGVGFPISIGCGLLVMGLALPHATIPLGRLFEQAFQFINELPVSR
jgi:flagellar biosynthetic protein FliR